MHLVEIAAMLIDEGGRIRSVFTKQLKEPGAGRKEQTV